VTAASSDVVMHHQQSPLHLDSRVVKS
jgi:hypothetical protein